jgi:chromate transporter
VVASPAQQAKAMKQLDDIAGVFAYLSLLTVGGGMAAFPELKTLTVDTYHWVTFPELLHFYSFGQLAPGPNMMMVASIGAVVAGIPGALVALVAFFLPTGLLTLAVGRLWTHLATWRWRSAVEMGMGSVSVGLVLAGAFIMGRGALFNWLYVAMALVVFFLLLRGRINPAYPIVACGVIGILAHWLDIAQTA